MRVYMVVFVKFDEVAQRKIRKKYSDQYYELTSRIFFIAPEKVTTCVKIADKIGMNSKKDAFGMVVEMQRYNGFMSKDAWEWVDNMKEV